MLGMKQEGAGAGVWEGSALDPVQREGLASVVKVLPYAAIHRGLEV